MYVCCTQVQIRKKIKKSQYLTEIERFYIFKTDKSRVTEIFTNIWENYIGGRMGRKKKSPEEIALIKKISFNIKKARKTKKLTQEQLAEKSHISYDFMRRIESHGSECGFTIFTLYKIALALDTGVDELMEIDLKEDVNE